ncbi:MAG TPA: HlyD family secretion protein [Rhizomicrobium sp.]|jgi:membrane fusion protein (multidrug efflux system)|nr:HlyD family secretion protein [Rhizomicrobium sp.]
MSSPAAPSQNWFGRNRRLLLIGGPVAVVVVAAIFYLMTGRYVSTDDAYIQAARADISTEVAGRIREIDVRDNQYVHKGDVLFRLDTPAFNIAVADARAQLAAAMIKVPSLQAVYRQRLADQAAAKNTLDYDQRELARQTELQGQGISSRAQLDQAKNNFQSAEQQLAAAQQQTASALADLGGNANAQSASLPLVRQAQANLDHALLQLSYTIVHAPMDGIVAKVDQIQVGDHVNAATPLFALMSSSNLWVEANFKETDLTHMRPGQRATFSVDAYPGRTFTGHVLSTSPGTGSSFSLLPPENSSGNWVKVVQRLPVRLSIDNNGDVPLAAGMSVEADVDTEHRRWD